jgi:hypothetical protein
MKQMILAVGALLVALAVTNVAEAARRDGSHRSSKVHRNKKKHTNRKWHRKTHRNTKGWSGRKDRSSTKGERSTVGARKNDPSTQKQGTGLRPLQTSTLRQSRLLTTPVEAVKRIR